jgi:predicted nucleotide-binding protein
LKIIDDLSKGGDSISEELIRKIKSLIKEGNSFDLTSSTRSTSKYQRWKTEVKNLILSQCGVSSRNFQSYVEGQNELNYSFESGHGQILGSLHTTLTSLELAAESKKNELLVKNVSPRNDKTIRISEKMQMEDKKKVFIVHGHDEKLKNQLEILLTEIGLQPVILHRKPDEGMTIIEKFEKHSDVGYAFILLSPDDVLFSINGENISEGKANKEMRARQNVIWEFGFFVGKLGRNRVCCLYKEGVILPTDVSGMLYKEIRNDVEEVAFAILKDLRAAGYDLQVP